MPRMSVPMRVRRRQSDAKWRASVATCYDTLKHIIPNNEKMSKRKISKVRQSLKQALILAQTEKHIENLENCLKDLLGKKAKSRNKAVLYNNDLGLVEANLDDIKQDFSIRQKPLYLQSSMQRKKSSIPSDVETGLVNLRSTVCDLKVIPSELLQHQVVPDINTDKLMTRSSTSTRSSTATRSSTKDKLVEPIHSVKKSTDGEVPVFNLNEEVLSGQSVIVLNVDDNNNIQSMKIEEPPYSTKMESLLKTPIKAKRQYNRNKKKGRPVVRKVNYKALENTENICPEQLTPCKTVHRGKCVQVTPTSGKKAVRKRANPLTPLRVNQSPLGGGNSTTGFTPIKLPDNVVYDTPSKLQESPMFTTWSFMGTPGGCSERYLDDEEIDVASLLCTEDINQMDLGDEEHSDDDYKTPYNLEGRFRVQKEKIEHGKTPRKKSLSPRLGKKSAKTKSSCRRQLEKCFPKQDDVTGVFENTDDDCLDFDGYFMFYQHVANAEKESKPLDEMATKVSCMWQKMSDEDRNAFVAMAALENTQSDSSNLSEDLMDLKMEPLPKEDSMELFSQESNFSQVVPDMMKSELSNESRGYDILTNENDVRHLLTNPDKVYVLPINDFPEKIILPSQNDMDCQMVPGDMDLDPQIVEIQTEAFPSPLKLDYSTVDEMELFTLSYIEKNRTSPDIVEEFVDQDWNSQIVPDFDFTSVDEESIG